jgi:DnaJ family protein A protein 1
MEPGLEQAGDIIVVLDEKEHDVYKRVRTDDLLLNMDLTLTEALCGFQRGIKTLDNRTLVITSLPGEVVKHGSVKCVFGEGMPRYKNPFEKGKLIVQFLVKFPDNIDPRRIDQLENILPPRPQVDLPMIWTSNKKRLINAEIADVKLMMKTVMNTHITDQGFNALLIDFYYYIMSFNL